MEQLMRSAQAGRIVHALLFCGPHGTGKKSMARVLARAALCMGAGEKPCDACPACKRFLNDSQPDVHYLAPEKNTIKVDQIRALVEKRRDWILAQLARQPVVQPLTEDQLALLRERAKLVFSQKVAQIAPLVGVSYGNVTVRFQSTRWGSCSGKGNLNFNGLLLLAPPEVLEYVVVHELCHRKEMNHSKKFWALVEGILPDYLNRRKWLKENGAALLARMPK